MVGYSRLMEADESGTIARQKAYRKELIDPKIFEHRGRIVKTMGDGVLVEFASVVDALHCAVVIQRAMVECEAEVPEDLRIQYRIGINTGDIVIDGDDILGGGVNIAARLEGLAEPGGICIPRKVFHEVRNKFDVGYEFIGEQKIKNIETPIPVYRVLLVPEAAQVIGEKRRSRLQRQWGGVAAIGFATAIVAVAAMWWQPWVKRSEPDPLAGIALPLPDKPSIAVLAFQNMSDDPSQEYFADGMSEDIITGLSKLSALFVIARNSSFQYKGQVVDVKRVGRELGVKFLVEGSVRRAGDQVRITAQLIDTETGGHLWAERYDGTLDDVFALQDQVTSRIVLALLVTLGADDRAKLSNHGTTSVEAYDAFLRGQELARGYELEDLAAAIEHYKRALELDPDYSRASAAIGQILYYVWRDPSGMGRRVGLPLPNEAIQIAKQYVQKALEKPVPAAHIAQALLLQPGRRYDQAIDHAQMAIALDPNDAEGYLGLANLLVIAGEPESAIEHFESGRRLDPLNSERIDQGLGLAYFGMNRFDDAARYLERARNAAPDNNLNWMYLAATYAHLGRIDDATAAADKMNALRREQGINSFRADMLFVWYFKEKGDENRLRDGLLKAGVPEKTY
jgi:TolB-like protein